MSELKELHDFLPEIIKRIRTTDKLVGIGQLQLLMLQFRHVPPKGNHDVIERLCIAKAEMLGVRNRHFMQLGLAALRRGKRKAAAKADANVHIGETSAIAGGTPMNLEPSTVPTADAVRLFQRHGDGGMKVPEAQPHESA